MFRDCLLECRHGFVDVARSRQGLAASDGVVVRRRPSLVAASAALCFVDQARYLLRLPFVTGQLDQMIEERIAVGDGRSADRLAGEPSGEFGCVEPQSRAKAAPTSSSDKVSSFNSARPAELNASKSISAPSTGAATATPSLCRNRSKS